MCYINTVNGQNDEKPLGGCEEEVPVGVDPV